MSLRVLVAEDEEITRKHVINTLSGAGHVVEGVDNGLDAFNKIVADEFDVLIADIRMPKLGGLDLLERVKGALPDLDVIIITGFGSINSAVEAMKLGASDYLPKPFDLDELILKVNKLQGHKMLKRENVALKTFLNIERDISIVAESASMRSVIDVIGNIRDTDCSVLLTGESGVGKNLLAKVIHYSSPRKARPLLSINCATFTEDLLASELFGYEKGAFTGAMGQKQGLMEVSDSGTLYLDEIAEMPTNLQAKLLKVIEDGEFYRVGGTRLIRVDVRFIAATNQHIAESIINGGFRKDLYYRLNVMEIDIPPLRDRKTDIEPLTRYFLKKHLPHYRKEIKGLTVDAIRILKNYSFPGNVRELENIIERAIILEKGKYITPQSLPQTLTRFQIETVEPGKIMPIDEINKQYARSVVEMLGGNKTEAAKLLGISRTSLWRLLKDD